MARKRKKTSNFETIVLACVGAGVLAAVNAGSLGLLLIIIAIISLATYGMTSSFDYSNGLLLEDLKKMDSYEFERYVGSVFNRLGYTVMQTKRTRDGGKDLIMYKNGQTYYVEVKRYGRKAIGSPLIQQLVGASKYSNAKPVFVTTSRFSRDAIKEASKNNVELIDGNKLMSLLK